MSEIGSLVVRLEANATNLMENMNKAADKVSSFGDGMKKLGAVIAGTFAVDKIVDFFKSTVEDAGKAQETMAQLGAVLESTGGIAGVTSESAVKLAEGLSGVTKFSKGAVLGAENMLLTFTNIGKDIFPQTTTAVLNMSTALGQDLKSSSIQLGKALQDPVAGVTALQRVGVKLTEAQKEQVKSFMAVGDIASAQKVIIKELDTEFGNSAVMAGQTFPGKVKILTDKFEELKIKIGDKLIPILANMADWFMAHMPEIQKFTEDAFNKVSEVFKFAEDHANILKPLIIGLVTVFGLYELALTAVAIKTNVLKLASEAQIIAMGALKVATGIATAAQWLFNVALDANPIGVVIIAIGLIGAAIYELVKHFTDITNAIKDAWNWLTKWNITPAKNKEIHTGIFADQQQSTGPVRTGAIPAFATGTNFVPYDMVAKIHKGEAIVPARNNPSNPNANDSMGGGVTVTGNTFIVRQESDIKAIATEIFNMQRTQKFALGSV